MKNISKQIQANDDVWLQFPLLHFLKELQGELPLKGKLEGVDNRTWMCFTSSQKYPCTSPMAPGRGGSHGFSNRPVFADYLCGCTVGISRNISSLKRNRIKRPDLPPFPAVPGSPTDPPNHNLGGTALFLAAPLKQFSSLPAHRGHADPQRMGSCRDSLFFNHFSVFNCSLNDFRCGR